jgi:hypothetical protein
MLLSLLFCVDYTVDGASKARHRLMEKSISQRDFILAFEINSVYLLSVRGMLRLNGISWNETASTGCPPRPPDLSSDMEQPLSSHGHFSRAI